MSHAQAVPPPVVSVVIISHGHEAYLDACLTSLGTALSGLRCEALIVDNVDNLAGDSNGEPRMDRIVQGRDFPIRVHRNARQIGFAANCNQAFQMTRGEYVLVLNPDTVLLSGHLGDAVKYLEANPHVGILGSRLVDKEGARQDSFRCFPSVPVFALRLMGADRWKWRPAFYRDSLLEGQDFREPTRVDLVIGAFFLVRRSCFERIGGFDELFFLYYEDADFCFRARAAGMETHYFPALTLMHHHQRSSKSAFGRHARWHAGSALRYFLKHRYFWRPVFGQAGGR